MNIFNYTLNYFDEQNRVNAMLPMHFVAEGLQVIEKAYREGRQVFLIGNGGSASTASHIACDLQKSTLPKLGHTESPVAAKHLGRFRVISLCDNTEIITAWANDVSYEVIFSEQLKTLAHEHDMLIAISASGNSPNIIRAVEVAKLKGMTVIGLSGFTGGKLQMMADVPVHVDSHDYGIVENAHLMFGHLATKYLIDLGR